MQELLFSFVLSLHVQALQYRKLIYFTIITMKKSWIRILLLLAIALIVWSVKGTGNNIVDTVKEWVEIAEDAADSVEEVVDDAADQIEDLVEGENDDWDDESDNENDNTLATIDMENSSVKRAGRSGPKSHNGDIAIKTATLSMTDGAISGGTFVMDMTSITATDIDSDWLDNHLKAEDFFDVENHPTATMKITNVDGNTITADLTIKWETFPVTFDAQMWEGTVSTSFSIDGTQWWVNDSWIKDALVSDTIDLDIMLSYE